MDKKKKIYIGIIVACVLVSGGLLYYSFGSKSSEPVAAPIVDNVPAAAPADLPAGSGYRIPAVFPADTKFDTSVFDSSKYKSLRVVQPLTVDESEVGRDDPFTSY